jgi:hypothetical protein
MGKREGGGREKFVRTARVKRERGEKCSGDRGWRQKHEIRGGREESTPSFRAEASFRSSIAFWGVHHILSGRGV